MSIFNENDEGKNSHYPDNASVSCTGKPKDKELTKVPVMAQIDPTNRPITYLPVKDYFHQRFAFLFMFSLLDCKLNFVLMITSDY